MFKHTSVFILLIVLFLICIIFWTIFRVPAVSTSSSLLNEHRGQAPMGTPPLEERISSARAIVLAKTVVDVSGFRYRITDVWKPVEKTGEFINDSVLQLNTQIHEQLGYIPKADQIVVIFFSNDDSQQKNLSEILPVDNGNVTYAPNDVEMKQRFSLDDLKKKIQESN